MKKRKIKFTSNGEKKIVEQFIDNLSNRLNLGYYSKKMMINDYKNAIITYQNMGLSITEILSRLDITRLGEVFTFDDNRFFPLDNSAIVYPLAMGHGSMGMFRLSYYLTKDIHPAILQIALNNIMQRFPSFRTSLKRGLFWHFLDSTKSYFRVYLDNSIPCALINLSSYKNQAFRVYYFQNRISIDFFHILTDGNGGLIFLNTLLCEYLRLIGEPICYTYNVLKPEEKPHEEEINDAFENIPEQKGTSSFADKAPHQLNGSISRTRKRVIHLTMDSTKLHEVAKKHNITITNLLICYMFLAIKETTKYTKGNFYIQVPVNMRKFYPSETLRNFALYAIIKVNIDEINDIDSLSQIINKQLQEKTSQKEMDDMATMAKKLVKSLNFVPLCIKYVIMKIIYPFLSERVISSTISNLGVIKLPNELSSHIKKADFVLGVQTINRAVCSVVTINNQTVFSISKITKDTSFEEALAKNFENEGITLEVNGGENFGL